MASNVDRHLKRYSSSEYKHTRSHIRNENEKFACGFSNIIFEHSLTYLCVLLFFQYNFLICDASITTLAPSTVVHVLDNGHHKIESPFAAAAEAAVAAAFGSLTAATSPHPTITVHSSSSSSKSHPSSHIKLASGDRKHTTSKPVIVEEVSSTVVEKATVTPSPSPSSHPTSSPSPSTDKLSEAKKSLIDDLVAELRDKQVQEIAKELSTDGDKLEKIKITSTTTIATTSKPSGSNVKLHQTTGKLISESELIQQIPPPSGGENAAVPAVLATTVNVAGAPTTTQHPSPTHQHLINNEPLVLIEPPNHHQQQQQQHVQIQQVNPTHSPSLVVSESASHETPAGPANHNTTLVVPSPVPASPGSPAQVFTQATSVQGGDVKNLDKMPAVSTVNVSLASNETNKQTVNVSVTETQVLEKPLEPQSHSQTPLAIAVPIPTPEHQSNTPRMVPVVEPTQPINHTIQVTASVGNGSIPPSPVSTLPLPIPIPLPVPASAPAPVPVVVNVTTVPTAVPTVVPQNGQLLNVTVRSNETIAGTNQGQQTAANASIDMTVKIQTTVAPSFTPSDSNLLTHQPAAAGAVVDAAVLHNPIEAPKLMAQDSANGAGAGTIIPHLVQAAKNLAPVFPTPIGLGPTQPTIAPIIPIVPPSHAVAPLAHLISSSINPTLGATKTEAPPAAVMVEAHASISPPSLHGSSNDTTSRAQASVISQAANITVNSVSVASQPATLKPTTNESHSTEHVDISLDVATKNTAATATTTTTTAPVISVAQTSNKTQVNGAANSSIEIHGKDSKSTVIVVDKGAAKSTTTTVKPIKEKKKKKKLNSLDSKLLKLKSKFEAANIHDVIVVGDHVDGDDLLEDYDEHSEHHNEHEDEAKDADDDDDVAGGGHHEHHDSVELRLDHESTTLAPSSTAKPSTTKGIEINVSDTGDKSGKINVKSKEKVKKEKKTEDHDDHEHLLKGLSSGDVIHIDVGDLE